MLPWETSLWGCTKNFELRRALSYQVGPKSYNKCPYKKHTEKTEGEGEEAGWP